MIKIIFPDYWSAEDVMIVLELFEHMKLCIYQQYGEQIQDWKRAMTAGCEPEEEEVLEMASPSASSSTFESTDDCPF